MSKALIGITEGDPLYSVWIWRRDSMLLARLREPLIELQVMAMIPCEDPGEEGLNCGACLPCQIRKVWAKAEAATQANND